MNVEATSPYKDLRIYRDIADGVVNMASLFLYKAFIDFVLDNGVISMIIPKSFYAVNSWGKLRGKILNDYRLIAINDVGKAFENVGLEQGIVICAKEKLAQNQVIVLKDFININCIAQDYFRAQNVILTSATKDIFRIIEKIEKCPILLGNIADMPRGITEKSDNYSEIQNVGQIQVLGGTNIKQYQITDGNTRKPNRYVNKNLPSIRAKKDVFGQERIGYQNLMSSLPKVVATIIPAGIPTDDTINNLVLNDGVAYDYYSILAILNSSICTFYLKYRLLNCAKLTVHLDKPYVGALPIPNITPNQRQEIVSFVAKILDIKCQKSQAYTDEIEKRVNKLVYDLYGLDENERQIIENG